MIMRGRGHGGWNGTGACWRANDGVERQLPSCEPPGAEAGRDAAVRAGQICLLVLALSVLVWMATQARQVHCSLPHTSVE